MKQRQIPFSPPDITEAEIQSVCEALRSGWITTGPRTKELEKKLKDFTGAQGFAAFNSATASLECGLRALGIGPGDEVITSAYTYTATASPAVHLGAKVVLCDIIPGTYEMDLDQLRSLITPRTKAVIPVDLGGRMCDYDGIYEVVDSKRELWTPKGEMQQHFDRIPVVADAAHALGATYHGRPSGSVADFTSFSFHAVKNFTTAEGGGLSWIDNGFDSDELYHDLMLQSLHGQSKDALAKNQLGAWEYDILFPGWKCNMTDTLASIGLAQLERYPGLLARRRQMIEAYQEGLADMDVTLLRHFDERGDSSGHLMLVHMNGKDAEFRNAVIVKMAEAGVATNVHYKPLPMLTAYRNLGFDIADYPHAYEQFKSEITLPLHTRLSDEDVAYVISTFKDAYQAVSEGR